MACIGPVDMEMSYYLLLLALGLGWASYYALHSAFAALGPKRWVQAHVPKLLPHYRLLYNLWNGLGFVGLVWATVAMSRWPNPGGALWSLTPFCRGFTLAVIVLGAGIMLRCFTGYNPGEFLGFRAFSLARQTGSLHKGGMNAWVRHPLYLGTTLVVFGLASLFPYWPVIVAVAVYAVYLPLGTILEERKLRDEFGPAYDEYSKEVPMLVPRWPKANADA